MSRTVHTNICSGNKTGNKLSKTGGYPEPQNLMNPGLYHSRTPDLQIARDPRSVRPDEVARRLQHECRRAMHIPSRDVHVGVLDT